MGNDHAAGEPCCGSCKLGELTERGEVAFEASPLLVVGEGDTEAIVHVSRDARRLPLHRGQHFVVGRKADVVIDSPMASRRIFALDVTAEGAVFIQDVGSACGTFVNGARISGRYQLRRKDSIMVGGGYILFQQGEHVGVPTAIEQVWAQGSRPVAAVVASEAEPVAAAPASPLPALSPSAPAPVAADAIAPPHSLSTWQRILSLVD